MATTPILASPFGPEPFDEVPLPRAPLAQTLTQIRFPTQSALALGDDDVAKELARQLRPTYPVFNVETQFGVVITPEGATPTQEGARIWRLSSSDESWQLSFTANFLTLSTSRYTSREDFCVRLGEAWNLFFDVVGKPVVQRIGFRYINRVDEREFLDQLGAMVRPEVLGATFAGGPVAPIALSLTENHHVREGTDHLLARWGLLPPGQTFDPFTLPPHPKTSWVLDLDSFREFGSPVASSSDIPEIVRDLSHAAYRYFRWAVTPEFLRFFGGDV